MVRKLRIAFSVACGILCLLLIVLWVRSYWQVYRVAYTSTNNFVEAYCANGHGGFYWTETDPKALSAVPPPTIGWVLRSYPRPLGDTTQSAWTWGSTHLKIAAPVWLLAAIPILFSVIPWLHWRFSLRTLLIATTLTAVILGAIVYALK